MKSATQSKLLVLILVLQAFLVTNLWRGPGVSSTAYGEIPDTAGPRRETVEELKSLNAKMDKLIGILSSGNLQVKVAAPDEKRGR